MIDGIKKEGDKLRKEVVKRAMGYIVAAFGLVAGLAWNDAIKSLIELFFPLGGGSVAMKFGYAVLITVILVIVSIYLVRLLRSED
jgi:C4-dicarboxylate transporter